MPAGSLVQATSLRTLGLDGLFVQHYENTLADEEKEIGDLFQSVEVKTDRVNFAALYDVPVPIELTNGSGIPFASIDDYTHQVLVKTYAMGIPWSVEDEEDDQLQTIEPRVQELASEFARLRMRAARDMIVSTASLFSTVPTCYDGLYATSTSTRFGVAGGNEITGTGVTSGALKTDFYSLKARFKAFRRHTATAEAYWSGDALDDHRKWLLIYSASGSIEESAREAHGAQIILDTTGVAGVTNLLASNAPTLKFWDRVSGNDWYGIYRGSPSRKPFLIGYRHEAPIMLTWDEMQSDWAREFGLKGKAWRQRLAMGQFAPECIGKVDN